MILLIVTNRACDCCWYIWPVQFGTQVDLITSSCIYVLQRSSPSTDVDVVPWKSSYKGATEEVEIKR